MAMAALRLLSIFQRSGFGLTDGSMNQRTDRVVYIGRIPSRTIEFFSLKENIFIEIDWPYEYGKEVDTIRQTIFGPPAFKISLNLFSPN